MNSTYIDLLQKAALLILTPKCFENYFVKYDFFDGPCFSATLSKCLGITLILGSLLVKIPQLLKIYNNKSGEGISMLSVTLELTAITIHSSYNFINRFPFSAWGDAAFLGIQTLLVAVLVLYYGGSTINAFFYFLISVFVSFVLMSGLTPINVLWSLQGCNIFIAISGKLTQAYINWQHGSTGQLSAITLIMLFGGSLARIFTSIQETGDIILILTFIASSFANAVLVGQLFYYWNVVPKKEKTH